MVLLHWIRITLVSVAVIYASGSTTTTADSRQSGGTKSVQLLSPSPMSNNAPDQHFTQTMGADTDPETCCQTGETCCGFDCIPSDEAASTPCLRVDGGCCKVRPSPAPSPPTASTCCPDAEFCCGGTCLPDDAAQFSDCPADSDCCEQLERHTVGDEECCDEYMCCEGLTCCGGCVQRPLPPETVCPAAVCCTDYGPPADTSAATAWRRLKVALHQPLAVIVGVLVRMLA